MMIIKEHNTTFDPQTRCLELDLRSRCGTKLRFHPWDEGLAIERWEDGQWRPEREDPGLSLLASAEGDRLGGPIHAFVASIPREIQEMIRPFEHCQTLVLRLVSISRGARSLASRSPVLLMLVADALDRGELNEFQALALLNEPPVKILKSMGCVGTNEAVQVVERLNLPRLTSELLETVRRALSQPYTIHMLRYHLDITPAGLRFAVSRSPSRRIPGPSSTNPIPLPEMKRAG